MMFLDTETTSLNADAGILVTIGMILPNDETKILFADKPEKEKEIIISLLQILKSHKLPIVIWYSDFDIRFIVARSAKLGIDASEIYGYKIIDLCKLIQANLKLEGYSLDAVSKFFGFEKNLSVTGKDTQRLYLEFISGDERAKEKIIEHCKDDLNALKTIAEKLKPYVEKWLQGDKYASRYR